MSFNDVNVPNFFELTKENEKKKSIYNKNKWDWQYKSPTPNGTTNYKTIKN